MSTRQRNCSLGTFALLGLLSPSLMNAADLDRGAWDRLDRLHPGQKVEVIQKNSDLVKGEFVVFTADSVALRLQEREVAIDRTDVREVRISNGPARWKRAVFGAAVVAGAAGTAGFAGFLAVNPVTGFSLFTPTHSVIYSAQP